MIYDGKTYRNLQDQVAYLTAKWQQLADEIDEVRAQIPSKMIVEELPEEGDPLITYYVGPKGTEPNLYYEVWVWVQEEPDGPFVWRELEDTDQVDLSGYLEKQTGTTTNPQAYVKNADGTQGMLDVVNDATPSSIMLRDSNGRTKVAAPYGGGDAVNLTYANNNYLAKQTNTTATQQVYVKNEDGSQTMFDVLQGVAGAGSIVRRTTAGRIVCGDPTESNHAATKKFVDDNFLAKQTGTSTYAKLYAKDTDGTQTTFDMSTSHTVAGAVVRRYDEQVRVPTTPVNDNDATSKHYVDAVVGQLLYLHELVLTFADVSGTDDLEVLVYLVNGSPTAITSPTTDEYCRMTPSHGLLGSNTVAITKFPPSVVYGNLDSPRWNGFMYQYFSGGNLISAVVDSDSYTMTVTDVVVNF